MPSPELSLQIARVAAALDARPGESSPIRPALRARILRFLQLTRSAIYPKIFGEDTNADRAALLSQAAGELAELLSETVPEKERHEEILLSFFAAIPSGITDLEAFLDAHTENTVKYVIDKSLRWELRDILDQLNINERMIYPGTAGIAKWLARHYYVKSE